VQHRELGRSGVAVSRVILGCGNFGGVGSAPAFFGQGTPKDEAFRLMDAAWDLGVTTFDTADAYGGGLSQSEIAEQLGWPLFFALTALAAVPGIWLAVSLAGLSAPAAPPAPRAFSASRT